jgi:hypothetical protein
MQAVLGQQAGQVEMQLIGLLVVAVAVGVEKVATALFKLQELQVVVAAQEARAVMAVLLEDL